ncbi:MAG: gas vesicle protein GvpO [bacterium]
MAKSVQQIIEKAREELSKITGLELSTTIGAAKEEKGWKITLEMVEKHSIPDQMDILATYEVILDNDGGVIEFNRVKLRKRVDIETVEVE